MDFAFYQRLAEDAIAGREPTDELCLRILRDPQIDLLPLLNAAYAVRKHFHGKQVEVHILNNAQNGKCPEDCSYCAQARTSDADIEEYPLKSEDEILAEAERAYQAGAFRYCMVFAGRGPNEKRTQVLANLIRKIKERYPISVCVSAGLVDDAKAKVLKEAGLDRLNHNLNTSRSNYPNICTTHTYDDRVNTLLSAKRAGLDVCSGLIVGMGETLAEIVELAKTLRKVQSRSIPVNFLLPIEGNRLTQTEDSPLSPEFCLRVLSLFRFCNPDAELRAAAGREFHLRSMEVLCLYPANSLFLDGYLNGRGAERRRTYQMIKDAGFEISSEHGVDDLLREINADLQPGERPMEITVNGRASLKGVEELRPARATAAV